MKKILIVVDMQNDFITGSLGTKEAQDIVSNVKTKINKYENNGDMVIFTKDTHHTNYLTTQEGRNLPVEHCILDTWGHEICNELKELVKHCILKETFGHYNWGNTLYLGYGIPVREQIEEIELVGLCTDVCVISNAMVLKSIYPETLITVDASCCAGVTPESHKTALDAMKMCQINVIGE